MSAPLRMSLSRTQTNHVGVSRRVRNREEREMPRVRRQRIDLVSVETLEELTRRERLQRERAPGQAFQVGVIGEFSNGERVAPQLLDNFHGQVRAEPVDSLCVEQLDGGERVESTYLDDLEAGQSNECSRLRPRQASTHHRQRTPRARR
ncbi:hypothetical protein [Microbacterium memoriense]|uniref:Uncharacterized protein n=1 Tax=Microbacterium memoriense TaxID=2978350 RepID=A0ABT2P956_9MICO|nr:hypothetical protein [Microbacterium memoriense]MCT9001075.1 hypothetical protein [Microbacterium memoriense]